MGLLLQQRSASALGALQTACAAAAGAHADAQKSGIRWWISAMLVPVSGLHSETAAGWGQPVPACATRSSEA